MMSMKLPLWLRFMLLAGVGILATSASLSAYRYYTRPVTLSVAVGSIDGEAATAMSAIASRLVATNAPVRFKVIDSGTALQAAKAFSAGKVDLAVVRGDVGDLSQAQAVVVVSHVVALIIAPPASTIDGIDKLKGRPLRALCQRQARREHRDSPRTPRCRPACRQPATAARYCAGCAARGALPMPALRRPHDRDRGVRARLRAEVAPDAEQDRHIMSQTSRRPRSFPVPTRWLHAGSDTSRSDHGHQCAERPRMRSDHASRCPCTLTTSPACISAARSLPASRPPSRSAPA
jgi:hypothetical protein